MTEQRVPRPTCSVCGAWFGAPMYQSGDEASLTSLCRIHPIRTLVYCCHACAHAQTPPLDALPQYYAQDYDILVDSEEEDQIYEMRGATPVFRTAHQVDTLLRKLAPNGGLRILDYGCAKSSTMRALLDSHPALDVHLFDVSDRYVPYWRTFVGADHWAVDETPRHWEGKFDVITSFFSLEHIPDLSTTLDHITSLLRPGGVLYAVVPHVLSNIADLIVVDHCNHFTVPSLRRLAHQHGLTVEGIDCEAHRGALVMVATKRTSAMEHRLDADEVHGAVRALEDAADYWATAGKEVVAFEDTLPVDLPVAIYGAGFYGAFIASSMRHPARIACHLDQNPFLQGKRFNDRPVLPPAEMPERVDTVLVGLNPRHARDIIAGIPSLRRGDLRLFFL